MKPERRIFIVIAAYNEQKAIGRVVKGLRRAGYTRVVVVDDCSRDATAREAKRAGAIVLRHAINRGQGAALRTGMDYALGQGADIIVHFDADGQHRVEDLPAMLKPVLNGAADITLGSRFLGKKSDIPFVRWVTLQIAILIQNLFYGIRLTDAHNGFRVMNRHAAQQIEITCDRMAHASEIAEQIKLKKLCYREVPIVITYSKESMYKGAGGFVQGVRVLLDMIFKKLT